MVAAQRAKVPVTLVDNSQQSIDKGLKFAGKLASRFERPIPNLLLEKLLDKDVAKNRISREDGIQPRETMKPTTNIDDLGDVDFVIEAVPVRTILSLESCRSLTQVSGDPKIEV